MVGRVSQGEAVVIQVAVHDVELFDVVEDRAVDRRLVDGEVVTRWIVMPEGLVDNRDESRGSARITGGEQRHVMTASDQLLSQGRHDTFSTTVAQRRNRLEWRSKLGDSQEHAV